MTTIEYLEYIIRVDAFFDHYGLTNLSYVPYGDHCCVCDEVGDEPHFSHTPCECCKRRLGGDREHANGYSKKHNEAYCFEVCPDCIYFAEYHMLDDMTMMDIDDDIFRRLHAGADPNDLLKELTE